MKKWLILLVALMMVGGAALAESPTLTLEEERLLVLPTYDERFVASYAARIKNTGQSALEIGTGVFEVKDKDGNVIQSSPWVNVYPSVLQPGEEAFVGQQEFPETATTKEAIASHFVDIQASTETYATVTRLPATAQVEDAANPDYESRTIYITATNDAGRELYDVAFVVVIRDDQGQLLLVDRTSAFGVAVAPDTQIKVRMDLNAMIDRYITAGEATLGTVEAFADVEEYSF